MRTVLQLFVCDVISKAIAALSLVLIVRTLSVADVAAYTLYIAAATALAQFLNAVSSRIYLVNEDDAGPRRAGEYLGGQWWCCAALLTAALVLAPWLGRAPVLVVLQASAFTAVEFSRVLLQRSGRFRRISLLELAQRTALLAGIALMVWGGTVPLTAASIVLAQVAVGLGIAALGMIDQVRWSAVAAAPKALLWRQLPVAGNRWLAGYYLVNAIHLHLPVFVIHLLSGEASQAVFGVAFRYFGLAQLVLSAVQTVIAPRVRDRQDPRSLERLLAEHRRWIPAFAAVVLAGMMLAGWILPVLHNGKYPEAVGVLRVLLLASIISFAASPYVNILHRHRDFAVLFGLILFTLVAHAALCGAATALFSFTGTAWATAVGYSLGNLVVLARARRLSRQHMPDEPVAALMRAA